MGYHGGKKKASITKKMTPVQAQGPLNEDELNAVPFKNALAQRMAIMKQQQNQVKDVERYDPKTGKSSMIYKPGRG